MRTGEVAHPSAAPFSTPRSFPGYHHSQKLSRDIRLKAITVPCTLPRRGPHQPCPWQGLWLSLILERSLQPSPRALAQPHHRHQSSEFLGKVLTDAPRPLPTDVNGHFMLLVRGGGSITSLTQQGRYTDKENLKFNKNVIEYFPASSWTIMQKSVA